MPPKNKNKSQATRSLRSQGPVNGVQEMLLADSGTSGTHRTGTTPHPPAVDAPRGREVTPQAEQPVKTIENTVKIPLRRRAKALSVQPTPVVAEVDTLPTHPRVPMANDRREAPLTATETPKEPGSGEPNAVAPSDLCPSVTTMPTLGSPASVAQDNIVGQAQPTYKKLEPLDHSDSVFASNSPKRFPARNLPERELPERNSSPGSGTLDWYRRHIEELCQPLYREFTGVSEPFLRTLEDAGRTRGGPRAVLAKLTKIAHTELRQQCGDNFEGGDPELEGTGREDGSRERNLLECVRRMIVQEAKIRRPSSRKNRTEDEPGKQGETQVEDEAMTCRSGDREGSGEGETPCSIGRTKLSKDDLQVATDLWDNVINPACIKFQEETGKPAEAMREALAGVIARQVRQNNTWNIWQKLWWKRPKVFDGTLRKQQCHEEYQEELKRHQTQEEIDAWTRELENNLAGVHELDAQTRAAKKIVDLQRELINISSLGARDYIHVLFFAFSVNPYNHDAQAMSGVGVGSEELRSLLVNSNQLLPLQVMLHELKTKLANQELDRHKAGKLPSVSSRGCMLKSVETSETERPDPLTKFKLFERENVTGLSDCQDNHDNDTAKNADQLPPLPANEALAQAVSQVQIPMDGWEPAHIFKLFVVLVEPPPGLDPSSMEGLQDYLSQLVVMIGGLVDNGIRDITLHCWRLLLALCRDETTVRKRAEWVPIFEALKKSRKRLVNWCPSIVFPTTGTFPKSRPLYRSVVNMIFNPDPARRLRLVPIEGAITDRTPIIINPATADGSHGCTFKHTTVTVHPSTISRWLQPMGAVGEPGPTTQSVAATTHTTSGTVISASAHSVGLLPMTQGLGVSSSDQIPFGFDFPMDPRSFVPSDPTDVFSLPPSSFLAPGEPARLYDNDSRNLTFNPSAGLGSTSQMFIPPGTSASAQNAYPSLVGRREKRTISPRPIQDDTFKRRRIEEQPRRVVEQVGYQRPTIAAGPPVASFNRPAWMSNEEYIKLLEAKITMESGAPARD